MMRPVVEGGGVLAAKTTMAQGNGGYTMARIRNGFTLVELMIGLVLSLIIMGVVTYGFFVTSEATKRGLGTNDLHEQAAATYALMQRDFANRIPGSEWVYSNNSFEFYKRQTNPDTNYDGVIDTSAGDEADPVKVIYSFTAIPSGHSLTESGGTPATNAQAAYYGYTRFEVVRTEGNSSSVLLSYGNSTNTVPVYLPVPPAVAPGYTAGSHSPTVTEDYGAVSLCNARGGRILLTAGDIDSSSVSDDSGKVAKIVYHGEDSLGLSMYVFSYVPSGVGTSTKYFRSNSYTSTASAVVGGGAPDSSMNFTFSANNANAPAYLRVRIPFVLTNDEATLTVPGMVDRRVGLDNTTFVDKAATSGTSARRGFTWYFKL